MSNDDELLRSLHQNLSELDAASAKAKIISKNLLLELIKTINPSISEDSSGISVKVNDFVNAIADYSSASTRAYMIRKMTMKEYERKIE